MDLRVPVDVRYYSLLASVATEDEVGHYDDPPSRTYHESYTYIERHIETRSGVGSLVQGPIDNRSIPCAYFRIDQEFDSPLRQTWFLHEREHVEHALRWLAAVEHEVHHLRIAIAEWDKRNSSTADATLSEED